MQGAFELGLVAILFVGLQVWWLSKVFFESSSAATTHRQTDAGQFTAKRTECLGEAVWKILIASTTSPNRTQHQWCWSEQDRRLGCEPNHHAGHRDRATDQREGKGELHAKT